MKEISTLFDQLDVSSELRPVLEAASKLNVDAMVELVEHVLNGKHTPQCGFTATKIINVILRQENIDEEKPRMWKLFSLSAQARRLHYEQGRDSFQRSMRDACDFMESMIQMMTKKPRSEWDVELLVQAVTWIKKYQPLLSDTEIIH